MATSTDIKNRASALSGKTDSNSVTPQEVGQLIYDTADLAEQAVRNGGSLGIRKVYASVSAMEADGTAPKDTWGNPMKKGSLCLIYDGTSTGADNNKVFAFTDPGWQIATHLDAAYATREMVEDITGLDDYPVFSATKAYAAGDVVNYNGKLYRFTANHTAGVWTGTDAAETDAVKAHIVQELGNDENAVMSQKATTDKITELEESTNTKFSELDKKFNELNISSLYPINGVDGGNTYTLETAIAQVPAEYRTIVGLKITFISNETSKPETWGYNGGTFTSTTNWNLGTDNEKLDKLNEDVTGLQKTIGTAGGGSIDISEQFIFTENGLIPGYTDGNIMLGVVYSSTKYSYSDFVDISEYVSITIKCLHLSLVSAAGLCFYSEGKQPLKGYTFNENSSNLNNLETESIEIPSGAKYIRTTIFINGEADFSCEALKGSGILLDIETIKQDNEKLKQDLASTKDGIVLSVSYSNENFTNGYIETVPIIEGTPLSLTIHNHNDWRCCIIDVSNNLYNAIVVSGLGGEAARLVCFIDSENVVISQSESLKVSSNEKLVIPEGTSKVVYNSRPKGYNTSAIYEAKISVYNNNALGLSDILGVETEESSVLGVIDCPETDIIKTYKNFILRESIEGTTRKFFYSNDSGATFTESENTLGLITYLAWFSTGRAIVATATNCYYTDDFKTFTESTVLDYNGEPFVPNSVHFGDLTACFHDETFVVNGKECMFWVDYGGSAGYIPRAWFTNDYGVTVKCVMKNNETIIEGSPLSIRHFHATAWDKFDNCIWINTGDHTNESYIIKGVLQEDDNWVFSIIQRGSANDKYGGMIVNRLYVDMISDFTGGRNTGILRMSKLLPQNSFKYVYNSGGTQPVSNYFFDSVGNRVLLHPGEVIGKILYAKRDLNFKQCTVRFNGAIKIPFYLSNNYNGTVVVVGYPSDWNPITDIYLNSQKLFIKSLVSFRENHSHNTFSVYQNC